MSSETHLIVLWANARSHEQEILEDIRHHLSICRVVEITWSQECTASNYARFYGLDQPASEHRAAECGSGPLLCVVVKDEAPRAAYVETRGGHQLLNPKLAELGEKYRNWTGSEYKVHTTCTQREVNHDSTLLLGLDYADLSTRYTAEWDGQIEALQQDLAGATGWKDWHQFFYTLNATLEYVLLRGSSWVNTSGCPPTEHGDVDLLICGARQAGLIIGGKTCYQTHTRKKQFISVGEQKVYIDLWDTANSYHDPAWERDILEHSEQQEPLMRVPNLRNQFYLLIYHCLVHKRKVAEDYRGALRDMALQLGCYNPDAGFDQYFILLARFMRDNHYVFTRPDDNNCFYCKLYEKLDDINRQLESQFSFSGIRPVQTDRAAAAGRLLLGCTAANATELILRMSTTAGICQSEFKLARKVYALEPELVQQPLYYNERGKWRFVALPRELAPTLQEYCEAAILTPERRQIFENELERMADALLTANVAHRDIQPCNILVREGHLVLTNFQYAVELTAYQEPDWLKQDTDLLASLGGRCAKAPFVFDDAHAVLKVLEYLGTPAESPVYQRIRSRIGQHELRCISRSSFAVRLQLLSLTLKRCFASSEKRKALKQEIRFIKQVYRNQHS